MNDYKQLSFIDTSCPKMPEEFKGQDKKWGGITKNVPREWTEQEIEWCLKLKQDGFTISDIAQSIDRDVTSVSIKLKRLTKKNDTYNAEHLLQKYQMNDEFYEKIKPIMKELGISE